MKNITKNLIHIFIIIFILNFVYLTNIIVLNAQTMRSDTFKQLSALARKSGYESTPGGVHEIETVVANIIQYVLSFLGVLFICLIIYAGFLWMTASGDSEKITKAKDILISAVIGIAIVLSAFVITSTVLNRLGAATGT